MTKGTPASNTHARRSVRDKQPSAKQIAQENEKLQEQLNRQAVEIAQLRSRPVKQRTQKKDLRASDDEEQFSDAGFVPESEDDEVPRFTSSAMPLETLGDATETQPLRRRSGHHPNRVPSSSPEPFELEAGNALDEREEVFTSPQPSQHKRPHSPEDNPDESQPSHKRPALNIKPPRKRPILNPGVNPTHRPKTGDYSGVVKTIIKDTIRRYEANIIAINAFPEEMMKSQWIVELWAQACKSVGDEYEVTPRICKLVEARSSRIRGAMLSEPTGVRVSVHHHFPFYEENVTDSVDHNKGLCQDLLRERNAFVYEDPKNMLGFMRNKILIKELRWIFHSHNKQSLGRTFPHLFTQISLPTLALLMTMTRFCIKEFETGKFTKQEFNEDNNQEELRSI
ncbi:hypothetical protein BDN72DRAFT_584255 [Pluteus cervinus]|uniref:Uncharacterized protein n=1 Tax=Pluteus cervinus TaxID=181527 RepID=A0ACD3A229_9AGAR|nr:hypothetical protein BDN72DRAFT_584255 [Pluteus cervinus]